MRTSIDSSSNYSNYSDYLASRTRECVRDVIASDDKRESMPHEHVSTLAAGLGLIFCALMVPRRTAAVAQAAVGGALLLRAAAGRDGLRKWSGAAGARPPVDPSAGTGTPANMSEAGL